MTDDGPMIGPDGFDVAAQIEREARRERGGLIENKAIKPGDELRVAGEWLDVVHAQPVATSDGVRTLLIADSGVEGVLARVFIAAPFALHRVRVAPPAKVTVSR